MSDRKSVGGIPAAPKSTPSLSAQKVRPSSGSRSELAAVQTAAQVPSSEARAAATTVALPEDAVSSVEAIMARLPDPASLPAGTLVIVPAEVAGRKSLAQSVLAVFSRAKTATRARRCSALVARGYIDVGAAQDESRADLAWGYATGARAPGET